MTEFHFLQPLDVLYLRGNRLFADASTPGEAVMPPWPSLSAGALRAQILAEQGIDGGRFAVGDARLPEAMAQCLGSPTEPGDFRISHLLLAKTDAGQIIDIYMPLPSDMIVSGFASDKPTQIQYLQPQKLAPQILCNARCGQIPVFRTATQAKPDSGLWLNRQGIAAWLNARPIRPEHLLESKRLWQTDPRLGIALDESARTTLEGQLYIVDTVAMAEDVGFLAGVSGAKGLLPETGVIRLGGDGRGARHGKIAWAMPEPDWSVIEQSKRFRVLLTTPGLFESGWLLPGMIEKNGEIIWQTDEFAAHLVSASITRSETVSGWDLAENKPKPALKAVNTGSVYWLDQFEGSIDSLHKLVEQGLSRIAVYPDKRRSAEGFNNIMIAAWPR
ncbi:type III-B CRISPR module-associated Cmr3 family protein [Methylomarinum vadi]|uniref:type III-B CRISPR module-associated Cmr3 family protein n=1 Tax=Methylomarinum vadi TaxID=438855 RepID=UPI0004DF10F5|nr:type III-B CRISPR module-associated Cmr3 family protein [Methylomarinum vadi]